jgi:hypothetical protein
MLRPLNEASCPSVLLLGCNQDVSLSGFFRFCNDFRLTHDTLPSLHGLTSQETPHTSTPLVKNATSVGLATGKAIGTSVVNKANRISEQTRQAHLGLFVISMSIGVKMNTIKSGAGRIEIGSIHPWRNYARKDNNV